MRLGLYPTKTQKDLLRKKEYNPDVWLIFQDDTKTMTIIHKITAHKVVIAK